MKSLLLTVASLLACIGITFGQNLPPDYYWEVGINAGYSNFTRPQGPAESYQGKRTFSCTDKSLRLNYYPSPNWMLTFDMGNRSWVSANDYLIHGQQGQELKTREVKFTIAENAINENIGISYVVPFYTSYNTYNKANLYFGVNVGLMQTMNDGSIGYAKYAAAPDSNLTYMSSYNYAAGNGVNFGIQLGYTWYITPRLGINLDLGLRYASIKTNDRRYGSQNMKYNLLYFPETIGLRWRF